MTALHHIKYFIKLNNKFIAKLKSITVHFINQTRLACEG